MKLKYRLTSKTPEALSFIKEIHLFKTTFGYKIVLNLKNRYFDIIAESSDEKSQGFVLSYKDNLSKEFLLDFSLFNFLEETYEMIISKNKDDLYLYFLKKGEQEHLESEVVSEEVVNSN